MLPADSAAEAALVAPDTVLGASHLNEVVAYLCKQQDASSLRPAPQPKAQAPELADMAEVRGHSAAKRVLEIAAAGNHHALMVGPLSSGKSMLAQRFASLLPPMQPDEALESAAVLSLVGRFDVAGWGQRPFR